MELDLTTAASGVEAQAILEKRKIDIVIMDINMPQMSGLELYDIVRGKMAFFVRSSFSRAILILTMYIRYISMQNMC